MDKIGAFFRLLSKQERILARKILDAKKPLALKELEAFAKIAGASKTTRRQLIDAMEHHGMLRIKKGAKNIYEPSQSPESRLLLNMILATEAEKFT